MKTVRVKSPTRVDLGGGTLDLWPIYSILGGACTINVAVDIYTEVELTERTDSQVLITLSDTGVSKSYSHLVEFLNDKDPKVALLRAQAEFFKPALGFELKTKSDSPVGGGLGGSSSLCVSLIRAFQNWLNLELTPHNLVHLAHNLEAQVLGLATGTQDYYPALLGGLCVIDYTQAAVQVKKLAAPTRLFSECAFLVYTGRPHHSGLNNWDVLKKFIEKDANVISCLKALRKKSFELRGYVLNNEWERLAQSFQNSYEWRTKLSHVFTSPEIERLREVALKSGADAVKICGAGGGGCVLVWSKPTEMEKVKLACQSAGFQILNAKAVDQGSH